MISFLLDEGVITVGTLSGLFTTALLNSLKRNVIDPSIDKVVPPHKLISSSSSDKSNEGFSDMFPIPGGNNSPSPTTVQWKIFLKDFVTWAIIMFFLYLFWKLVLHPNKLAKMGKFPSRPI